MQTKEWMKAAILAAGLCLIALPVYAQSQSSSQQTGDPVADAARKAREEKKSATKPKKVYTDDDVKPAVPDKPAVQNATAATPSVPGQAGAAGPPGAAGTPGAPAAGTAQKPGDSKQTEDPNSEKAWRKRFADQHAKIDKAQQELDVLQRELDKSQVQYYNDPQKAMTEQNNRAEINDKTAKIDAKKKEIEQLRAELDDMEAQLRKSGGDVGWAR